MKALYTPVIHVHDIAAERFMRLAQCTYIEPDGRRLSGTLQTKCLVTTITRHALTVTCSVVWWQREVWCAGTVMRWELDFRVPDIKDAEMRAASILQTTW